MNPTKMAEKQMFPTHESDSSDGEPDAVKVASPVRRGGDGANQPEQSGHRRRRSYPLGVRRGLRAAAQGEEGLPLLQPRTLPVRAVNGHDRRHRERRDDMRLAA